jgi:hypothetical protein
VAWERAAGQLGGKPLANQRGLVGAKLVYLVNHGGRVVGWDDASADVPDHAFQGLSRDFQDDMGIFTATSFQARAGDPPTMQPCRRGTWNGRRVVETGLALLTTVVGLKQLSHRTWRTLCARLAFTMAAFNILVQWNGLPVDADGKVHLSIAEFSL